MQARGNRPPPPLAVNCVESGAAVIPAEYATHVDPASPVNPVKAGLAYKVVATREGYTFSNGICFMTIVRWRQEPNL